MFKNIYIFFGILYSQITEMKAASLICLVFASAMTYASYLILVNPQFEYLEPYLGLTIILLAPLVFTIAGYTLYKSSSTKKQVDIAQITQQQPVQSSKRTYLSSGNAFSNNILIAPASGVLSTIGNGMVCWVASTALSTGPIVRDLQNYTVVWVDPAMVVSTGEVSLESTNLWVLASELEGPSPVVHIGDSEREEIRGANTVIVWMN
jgi:hypothetical protein